METWPQPDSLRRLLCVIAGAMNALDKTTDIESINRLMVGSLGCDYPS
jgi:hypothetical protein